MSQERGIHSAAGPPRLDCQQIGMPLQKAACRSAPSGNESSPTSLPAKLTIVPSDRRIAFNFRTGGVSIDMLHALHRVGNSLGMVVVLVSAAICLPARAEEGLRGVHTIRDAGAPRSFEIATDELYRARAHSATLRFPPVLSAEAVRLHAEMLRRQSGEDIALVLSERGVPRNDFTRRILTRTVVARLDEQVDVVQLARSLGIAAPVEVPGLRRWWQFDSSAVDGALHLAEVLRGTPGVRYAEPLLARRHQPKLLPNDPLFPQQWHLLNVGQGGATPGIDIGVSGVWDTRRGAGIVIGVVDDGLQVTHPDLAPNVNLNLGWDFNFNDPDPSPDSASDRHGTAVAGLAAARGNNNLGVTGVAYEAALAGLRLLGAPDTDAQDAAAMLHSNAVIQIKNNSWGAADGYGDLEGPGPLMIAALEQGTSAGRGGKGTVYVFAGGNGLAYGENVNYDGFANSMHVIAVGAVNDLGQQANYSEPGACLVVVAPSSSAGRQSITTTDLVGTPGYSSDDYTSLFRGTSAATPQVSGVIALVLQANGDLSWRDVKEILLRLARPISVADSDWSTNSAGIAHNQKFGAGVVNASAAVNLATNWFMLGPMTTSSHLQSNLNISIPDNTPAGIIQTFTVTNVSFRVEHVVLSVTLPHLRYGDLAITLTSPSGTQSRLAELHNSTGPSFAAWPLMSVRHWGELAHGTWTVQIADLAPGNTGTLSALQLDIYGTTPGALLTATHTATATQLALKAAAAGWRYSLETSTNLTAWTPLTTLTIPASGLAVFADSDIAVPVKFYRARLLQ